MARRSFIWGASAAGLALAVPVGMLPALASRQDYVLWLERADTGEQIAEPFTLDGLSLYKRGYYALCAALRDAHVPAWRGDVYIAVRLIELLWGIQRALAAQGVREPIVVHSGYRTPETNANTEGAAWNSLHMYGMAIDFHVPNVSISDLSDMCWSCPGAGGVGSYEGGWVHLDTGPHRFWNG